MWSRDLVSETSRVGLTAVAGDPFAGEKLVEGRVHDEYQCLLGDGMALALADTVARVDTGTQGEQVERQQQPGDDEDGQHCGHFGPRGYDVSIMLGRHWS